MPSNSGYLPASRLSHRAARLALAAALVAAVSVVVSTTESPVTAAPTTSECAGADDDYTNRITKFRVAGPEGGSRPNSIVLTHIGGHSSGLFSWRSVPGVSVSKIVVNGRPQTVDTPTGGQVRGPGTGNTTWPAIFCIGDTAQPSIELTKTSTSHPDADGNQVADSPIAVPGDIDYRLVATNTGNVELTGVTIADPKLGTLSCAQPATLAPNASLTCSGSTTVAIADIAAGGNVSNTASVAGTASGTTVRDGAFYLVPIADQPDITLVKTSTSNPDTDGDGVADTPITAPGTVDYLLTVTNSGNVALTDLGVSDPDVDGLTCGSGTPTFIAPGASFTCTGTQTVTQADIDAGGDIINTASASGRGGGHTVEDRDTFDVPIEQTITVTATKTSTSHPDGDGDGIADLPAKVDDIIDYVVVVENTGNVDVDITVTDSITTLTCGTSSGLAPGASTDCTGSYTVTQADVDAFVPITNTATVTPVGPSGNKGKPAIAGYVVPVLDNSALTVTKSSPTHPDADGDGIADTGVTGAPTTVEFEVEVANTGTTTITGITVADNYAVNCPSGATFDLAPGGTETCTASVDVDQTLFESEPGIVNVARAAGTDGGGNDIVGADSYLVRFERRSGITLTKVAQAPFDVDADGDGIADNPITGPVTVGYDLVATNTGNVTLTDVAVVDPLIGSLTCTVALLAPGDSLSCDDANGATITVDQGDIDAGGDVVNTATATAEDPDGSVVSDQAVWDIPISVVVDLSLTKVAQAPFDVDVDGDGIADNPITGPVDVDYDLVATNTGNVTLTGVTISDAMIPALVCGPADLAPGQSLSCDDGDGATITVDQGDVDAGGDVFNTAIAAGTDPDGDPVEQTASWDIPIQQNPALTLTKVAQAPFDVDVDGDGIADNPITGPVDVDYDLVATNTGNVTLTGVTISDAMIPALVCGPADLAPGQSLSCDDGDGATITVDQADVDAGGDLVNEARAAGSNPDGSRIFDTAKWDIPIDGSPAISLEKTPRTPYDTDVDGDRVSDTPITAPTTVTYDLVATNTGNVTLTAVDVTDPLLGSLSCDQTLPTTLAPGAAVSCTGTYVVTQADIDSASDIVNLALAGSPPQQVFDVTDWDIPITGDPSISLHKTSTNLADVDGDGVADTPVDAAPTTVDYELVVTNDGSVTLDDVSITDPQLGALDCGIATPPVTLAPGSTLTCTGSYEITQADLDAAQPVVNTATATGTGQGPSGLTKTSSDTFTVPLEPAPAISIAKQGLSPYLDGDNDGVSDTPLTAPDTVNYQLDATNVGNVTLTDVTVTDARIPGLVCGPVTLAPGASLSCNAADGAQIVVEQSDIDAGGDVVNEGTVIANFRGRSLTDSDSFDIPIQVNPALELVKVAQAPFDDSVGNGISDVPIIVPQTVTYDLVATNTGNVTLPSVEIGDPSLGALACDVAQPVDLAPGDTLMCSADRTVTQGEIDSGGFVANVAIATNPSGLLDTDGYVIPIQRIPGILVEKISTSNPDTDGDGIADTPITGVGPVDYVITVTNTGNTTLTDVVIDDPMLTGCTAFPVGTLAPTESATCTDTFDVPQALIDGGGDLLNTASAVGNAGGTLVLDRDTYDIPIDRNPSIVVTKSALAPFADSDGDGTADSAAVANDDIEYVVTVTNDGNVTLSSLSPVDSLVTLVCAEDAIAPGASTTCTGTYTVLQPDVDALVPIQNIAIVSGRSPSGQVVADADVYLVPVLAEPDLVIRKSIPANPDTDGDFIGDTPLTGPADVDYEIVVANGGTVSLTDVDLVDSLLPAIDCPSGTPFDLDVGDAETCTATFSVTQPIFDMGVVPPGGSEPFPGLINIATATATAPGPVTVAGAWLAGVVFDQQPSLVLTKTSTSNPDADGNGVADDPITAPTTIEYELVATNTGNVTLTNVTVTDPLLPTLSCGPASVAPGDALTCAGSLAVDQGDIDAGGDVLNIATATADFDDSQLSDRAAYDVPISANASLTLVKTSMSHPDADGDGIADAPLDAPGAIEYTLTATNSGNTTLVNVEIVDAALGTLACTPPIPATLAPGESIVCTGSDPVTQADIDAGGDIVNLAEATAFSVQEGDISDQSTYDVPIEQRPELAVTKTPVEQTFTIGDTVDVSWTITVSNSGNVTLTDLELTDQLVESITGDPTPVPACSLAIGDLAPGASETIVCEIERLITVEEFANLATVKGQAPSGEIGAAAAALVRSEAAPPPTTTPPTTTPPTTTPPDVLPPTGSDGSVLPIAFALIAVGAVALAIGRVRRSTGAV